LAVAELSAEEEELVGRVAAAVVRRQMAVPAVLLLESTKPLAFLGGQALHFLAPMVTAFVDLRELRALAGLLEDRDKVEALLRRIEALEARRLGRSGGGEGEEGAR
jgi:hypothetical protein